MTKREFMQAIIESAGVAQDLKDYAQQEINKLDDHNKARSSKPTAKQKENEKVKEAILAALSDDKPEVASVIAERIGQTTQKVSALCRQMVEAKKLEEMEVKIPKVGKRRAFKIAADVQTIHLVDEEPIEADEE